MEGAGARLAAIADAGAGVGRVPALLSEAEPGEALSGALSLIVSLDPLLGEIVARSLVVALCAAGAACALGLPLGAALAFASAPGRRALAGLLSALASLPPACVGVAAGLALAAAPPAGAALLGTPAALALAQALLAFPVAASLACAAVSAERRTHAAALRAMRVSRLFALGTLLA
ncbi:MAG: hypothetical protein ACU0DT_14790, partial [Albimonas sp.]